MWFQWLTRRSQVLVIGNLFTALYLWLILFWTSLATPSQVQRSLGQLGFQGADFLLATLGWSSFLLPAYLLWISYRMIRRPSPRPTWIRGSLMVLLTVGVALYLDLIFPSARANGYSISGLVGADFGELTREQLGRTGGLFILSVVLLISAFLSGKLNLESLYVQSSLVWDSLLRLWEKRRPALEGTLSETRHTSHTGTFRSTRSRQGTKILEPVWLTDAPLLTTNAIPVMQNSLALKESTPETSALLLDTIVEERELPVAKKASRKSKAERAAEKNEEEALAVAETEASPEPAVEANPLAPRFKSSTSFALPDTNLLHSHKSSAAALSEKEKKSGIQRLLQCLETFEIKGEIVDVIQGPRVVTYEFKPDTGMKLSKLQSLTEDLGLALGEANLRIVAPLPGKKTVGFEVPRKESETIGFKKLIADADKALKRARLPVVMGRDLYGEVVIADLASMPHLLVAGSTGSGKSIFINTLLTSFLYTRSPHELELALVDPKMIEFSAYNDIPHLREKVIVNPEEAKALLERATKEMDERYVRLNQLGCRDIDAFNQTIKKSSKRAEEKRRGQTFDWAWSPMRYFVIVVDEMADLMMTQGKEVEIPLTRLAQKARACGIHLVLATQRPSSEVITGLIKTNFPSRIAFKVSASLDSRTILDTNGAEKLLGRGDMLFMTPGKDIQRLHGGLLTEEEVQQVTAFWRKQNPSK